MRTTGYDLVAATLAATLICLPGLCRGDVYERREADGSVVLTDRAEGPEDRLVYREDRADGAPGPVPQAGPRTVAALPMAQLIDNAARASGVDPLLVHAVVRAESAYNPSAVSVKGAAGLMQLMPGTARRFGVVDRFSAEQNLAGGTRYLRFLLDMFDGELVLAIAAYNAGEGAVLRHGRRVPPYPESIEYVRRVTEHLRRLRRHPA